MQSAKLIQTCLTFSTEEWTDLRKTIYANHRSDSDIVDLFNFLYKRKDRLESLKTKEAVRRKHFEKLTSKGFLNLLSRLYNEVEDWLVFYEYRSNNHQKKLLLLKTFNNRGLYKQADALAKSMIDEANALLNTNVAKDQILLDVYDAQYYSNNPIKYQKELGKEYLQFIQMYLERLTRSRASIYLAELSNWSDIRNVDLSNSIERLRSLTEMLDVHPEMKVYNDALVSLFENTTAEPFYILKDGLLGGKLEQGDLLHDIVCYALMTKIFKLLNKKVLTESRNLVDIYNYVLGTDLLIKHGKIPSVRFENMVVHMAQKLSFDETSEFILKWINRVNTEYPGAQVNACMAINAFYNKRYSDLLNYTNDQHFSGPRSKQRILLFEIIGMYYSKTIDYNSLLMKIKNFKRYLKRNAAKYSKHNGESKMNLLKIMELHHKAKFDSSITIDLSKYENIFYRTWVEEELLKIK